MFLYKFFLLSLVTIILTFVFIKNPKNIFLGSNIFLNHNCCLWASKKGSIHIGDNVLFGPGVCVIASNHGTKSGLAIMYQDDIDKPITIGNDVWIGYGATIMPGINIGDGAIIGAQSVVTRDVPSYRIVGGNPAQEIRKRFEDSMIEDLLNIRWWDWDIQKITRHLHAICGADIEVLRRAFDSE